MRNAVATRQKQHLHNLDVSTRTTIGSRCEVVEKIKTDVVSSGSARIGLIGRPKFPFSSATELPCLLREIISLATSMLSHLSRAGPAARLQALGVGYPRAPPS
mmetsp:Transcript_106621/g.168452  ORF Transcript_106621/g.168452 Transcript_106621/m.168452 type:complete len:103 (+) Transcript_106621:235-543(+)